MNMQVDSRRHARGFTLIELMIAIILGLIVIAGVTSVFLAGQQSFRTNNALADVQDGSRIAFELMARDIREAGLTGCNSMNNRVTNVLKNSPGNKATPDWWADWSNAVHGYGGVGLTGDPNDGDVNQDDPAVTTGSATGQRVAGTDSLELLNAGNADVTITTDVKGTGFTLSNATSEIGVGDIIVACSPDHAAILQVTGPTGTGGTTLELNYNTGSSVSPGNCSNNLGYPNDACTGNSPDYTFPPNSSIAKLTAADWYIGNNPDGGQSLYRIALTNGGKGVSPQAQEMVRNVTDMQIGYLNPSIGAIGTKFVPAATITADNGWAGVTAVRVTLKLESNFGRASVSGKKPIERSYAFTTTLRNRVN